MSEEPRINMYEVQVVEYDDRPGGGGRFRYTRSYNVITTSPDRAIELTRAARPSLDQVVSVIRRNSGPFISDPMLEANPS